MTCVTKARSISSSNAHASWVNAKKIIVQQVAAPERSLGLISVIISQFSKDSGEDSDSSWAVSSAH